MLVKQTQVFFKYFHSILFFEYILINITESSNYLFRMKKYY